MPPVKTAVPALAAPIYDAYLDCLAARGVGNKSFDSGARCFLARYPDPQAWAGLPLEARLAALPHVDVTTSPDWVANSSFVIARNFVYIRQRFGHWRYSPTGSDEQAREVPPYYRRMLEQHHHMEVEANKSARKVRAEHLYEPSRDVRAVAKEATYERIRMLAKIHKGHKRIANAAGCSVATVKRALQKLK